MCSLYVYTSQYLKENFTVRCIIFSLRTDIGKQTITFSSLLIRKIQSFTTNINVNTATYKLGLKKPDESVRFRIEGNSFIFLDTFTFSVRI